MDIIHAELSREFETVEIFPLSDLHIGSSGVDYTLFDQYIKHILAAENRFIVYNGDNMNNATKLSKSNCYAETMRPREQKRWLIEHLEPVKDRILVFNEGNHEARSSKDTDQSIVEDIAVALGVDPGVADLSGLRYGRICILADADSDGLHIATLLCALFYKHFPSMVREGRVCVAMPPLYRIDIGKTTFYALDEEEKQNVLAQIEKDKLRGKVNVQRFKGLGEMNTGRLRETTMDPHTRRLVQLGVQDASGAGKIMDMLLAKKRAADRKTWLTERGDEADVA